MPRPKPEKTGRKTVRLSAVGVKDPRPSALEDDLEQKIRDLIAEELGLLELSEAVGDVRKEGLRGQDGADGDKGDKGDIGTPGILGIQNAYLKDDAGSGTTETCYLETDGAGDQVTVNFSITQGHTALNTAMPLLKDGDMVWVIKVGNDYYCLGAPFNPSQVCT